MKIRTLRKNGINTSITYHFNDSFGEAFYNKYIMLFKRSVGVNKMYFTQENHTPNRKYDFKLLKRNK